MFSFLLFIVVLIFVNGFMELQFINQDINNFIDCCEYEEEIVYKEYKINLYCCKAEKDNEKNNYLDTITISDNKIYLGNKSDIIVTNRNPFNRYGGAFLTDVAEMVVHPLYSGHAAVNLSVNEIIECVGIGDGDSVRIKENCWFDDIIDFGQEDETYVGLRFKNVSQEDKEKYTTELKKEVNKKYTYSYFIHTKNTYYCTDLVTRIAKKIDVNLNYDGFVSTGNDIIISDNTFIIFIVRKIDLKNKIINIYYMKEE